MGLLQKAFGGSTTNPAKIDPTQQPFLKDIYGQAQTLAGDTTGQEFGQQFQQPTFGAFSSLAQGGMQVPGLQENLMNFGNMQDEYLGGAIDAGINDINRNFTQNIMPSINQGAAMSGTSGGSRQGIAQGVAAGEANRNVSDFVNRMRSGNFADSMRNRLGASGQLINTQGQANQAMGAAVANAPAVSNLGFQNQFGNLNRYKNLVGGPTVLSGGGSAQSGVFAPIKLN